jgi:hypothetical protein
MLIETKLDKLAKTIIPPGNHELLHINSREAWVKAVMELINYGSVEEKDKKVIANLANNWEQVLAVKYSILN